MTPGASGAQDQPERSIASTDKLIEKMHRPSEAHRFSGEIAVREKEAFPWIHLKAERSNPYFLQTLAVVLHDQPKRVSLQSSSGLENLSFCTGRLPVERSNKLCACDLANSLVMPQPSTEVTLQFLAANADELKAAIKATVAGTSVNLFNFISPTPKKYNAEVYG